MHWIIGGSVKRLGYISFPVWARAPSPSCAEHPAIGHSPVPGCADWLAPTLITYNWPIIYCMPHLPYAHTHTSTQLWDTVEEWTHWEEGDARFVMYFWPHITDFLCVIFCVCLCMCVCDNSGYSVVCLRSEEITLCQANKSETTLPPPPSVYLTVWRLGCVWK